MKNRKNKGFTLAELLVVVAIIAVLVAISIPIFTSQLEKSREATDEANLRSAYAAVISSVLTESAANSSITAGTDGSYSMEVKATQKEANWVSGEKVNIGGIDVQAVTSPNSWTVTATKDGTVTFKQK